jgi:hypothetical protein
MGTRTRRTCSLVAYALVWIPGSATGEWQCAWAAGAEAGSWKEVILCPHPAPYGSCLHKSYRARCLLCATMDQWSAAATLRPLMRASCSTLHHKEPMHVTELSTCSVVNSVASQDASPTAPLCPWDVQPICACVAASTLTRPQPGPGWWFIGVAAVGRDARCCKCDACPHAMGALKRLHCACHQVVLKHAPHVSGRWGRGGAGCVRGSGHTARNNVQWGSFNS